MIYALSELQEALEHVSGCMSERARHCHMHPGGAKSIAKMIKNSIVYSSLNRFSCNIAHSNRIYKVFWSVLYLQQKNIFYCFESDIVMGYQLPLWWDSSTHIFSINYMDRKSFTTAFQQYEFHANRPILCWVMVNRRRHCWPQWWKQKALILCELFYNKLL